MTTQYVGGLLGQHYYNVDVIISLSYVQLLCSTSKPELAGKKK